jgi:hypothetical protein
MPCCRTVSFASFAAVAAIAGHVQPVFAQQNATPRRPPPLLIVRDVIKPNPHDGALAAPVMSDTWWIRMADGRERGFQPARQTGPAGGRDVGAPARMD